MWKIDDVRLQKGMPKLRRLNSLRTRLILQNDAANDVVRFVLVTLSTQCVSRTLLRHRRV